MGGSHKHINVLVAPPICLVTFTFKVSLARNRFAAKAVGLLLFCDGMFVGKGCPRTPSQWGRIMTSLYQPSRWSATFSSTSRCWDVEYGTQKLSGSLSKIHHIYVVMIFVRVLKLLSTLQVSLWGMQATRPEMASSLLFIWKLVTTKTQEFGYILSFVFIHVSLVWLIGNIHKHMGVHQKTWPSYGCLHNLILCTKHVHRMTFAWDTRFLHNLAFSR